MKKTILLLTALMMTVLTYSQRQELRQINRSLNNNDYNAAKAVLSQLEGQLSSFDEATQAQFYLLQGQAFAGAANNNFNELKKAATSLRKVIEIERSGRQRFSDDAKQQLDVVIAALVNGAIEDQNNQRFSVASEKLHLSYELNNQDTLYLYFAALNSVQAEDYKTAASYYEKLINLGYTGIETEYFAIDASSGEEVQMSNEQEQRLAVMSGDFTNPTTRKTENRQPQILSDLVFIYANLDNLERAKELIKQAQAANPNSVNLMHAEANIAVQENDMVRYNQIMQNIIKTDPTNPELFYNLGVSSASIGEVDKAKEYYKKALELDPNFHNAKLNMAVLILDEESSIVEEMNNLGTSAADNRRYDQLRNKRTEVYNNAIPYLEGALEGRPNDVDLLRTLSNIYSIIGEDIKFKQLQDRINTLTN